MYSAFVKLLNMSAASGILIAAVIGLRFLLRKVPKKYICILWALVALRLICPVTISSSLSVFNHVGTYHPDNGQIGYIQYNGKTEKPMGEIPLVGSTISSPDGPTVEYHTPNFYLPTAMGIWAVGMAAMLLYAAISYSRIRWRTRESIRFRRNIYLCDRIPTPFILGMLRPRIFLPSDLSQEQIRSVVAHERAHIARLDHWWKPLGFLLLSIHWFNPLVWIAYGLLCRDIELACDEKVIQNMTASQKQAYSEVLLSCSLPRKFITACPVAFAEVGVKERIQRVLTFRKPTVWVMLAAIIVCILVAVCFLTNPVKSEPPKMTVSQMSITAEDVTNTGMTLTYHPENAFWDVDAITDGTYWLEKQSDSGWWQVIQPNQWVEPVLRPAEAPRQRTIHLTFTDNDHHTLNWSSLYGCLSAGKYRAGISFWEDGQEHILYAPFVLEEDPPETPRDVIASLRREDCIAEYHFVGQRESTELPAEKTDELIRVLQGLSEVELTAYQESPGPTAVISLESGVYRLKLRYDGRQIHLQMHVRSMCSTNITDWTITSDRLNALFEDLPVG